jgi:hypothetical protein
LFLDADFADFPTVMFSKGTYDEIGRLTYRALKEIASSRVIDAVADIRGYAHILAGTQTPGRYEAKIDAGRTVISGRR